MPDAIEGARYYDRVHGRECVVSAIYEADDRPSGVSVELNYDDVEGTIEVDLDVFRGSDGIEIRSIPNTRRVDD